MILFPEKDYITADNPVRFIGAFAARLDLAELGFTRVSPAETGRPAYDPADLLRLYLYGYFEPRAFITDPGAGSEIEPRSDVTAGETHVIYRIVSVMRFLDHIATFILPEDVGCHCGYKPSNDGVDRASAM